MLKWCCCRRAGKTVAIVSQEEAAVWYALQRSLLCLTRLLKFHCGSLIRTSRK